VPANLPPKYFSAEAAFRTAKTPQEKIAALKEMLAIIPKHKGTEKLQAELKRKIARLKEELQRGSSTKKGFSLYVEREGAGQVALVGPPNSGKSLLLKQSTHAHPEVADYPFTTRLPQPGMVFFEDVPIQLVDLPPVAPGYFENWVAGILRTADALALIVDASGSNPLEDLEAVERLLGERKIQLVREEPEFVEHPSVKPIRTVLVLNKMDAPGAQENAEVLEELYRHRFPVVRVSAREALGLQEFRRALFELLQVVRVYSKRPGHEPDLQKPFIFRSGATLNDFARAIHKDFAEKLRYARVWGHGRFEGQRITHEYILKDKDVIELHM